MRVTKSVVIHGSELPQALEDVLRESPRLGMHTGVVHLFLGSQQDATVLGVRKYVWAHHDYQPWGMVLPMQCPQCGTVQKWMSVYLQNNAYRYECGYPQCGYDDEARQAWPYTITVERPKGATLLRCHGGQGGWMKVCELSC